MRNLSASIINFLTNGYGFIMESYPNEDNGTVSWIGIKHVDEGDYAVIITDDVNDSRDTTRAINYLNSRGIHYGFHKIIISRSGYVNNDYYSKVVVDANSNSILYCDHDADVLARVIRNVIANKDRIKMNKPLGSRYKSMAGQLSIILIAINIVMYIISAFMAKNIMDIDVYTLVKLGGKVGVYVDLGQYWRLFTCMFLHGSLMHLAFNMYALYCIGPQIEQVFGKWKFLLIYFVSGLSSSIFSYIFGDPMVVSIGASGAIFGLFGALLIYAFIRRDRIQNGALSNLIFIVVLNLVIGFSSSNIDNLGHIGGLILGSIISFVFIKINDKKYA